MKADSNFKSYLISKYGTLDRGRKIILARRKRYHTDRFNNWLEFVFKNPDSCFIGYKYSWNANTSKSWHALRLIEKLIRY